MSRVPGLRVGAYLNPQPETINPHRGQGLGLRV